MDDKREQKMAAIKERIDSGEYKVDPAVVADAILRRWRELSVAPAGRVEPGAS